MLNIYQVIILVKTDKYNAINHYYSDLLLVSNCFITNYDIRSCSRALESNDRRKFSEVNSDCRVEV